jgi:predicted PurR-regulated permease PerM
LLLRERAEEMSSRHATATSARGGPREEKNAAAAHTPPAFARDRVRRKLRVAVLVGLALLAVALVLALLYPFAGALLFAAVLAGSFAPWVDRGEARLGGRRSLAALLVTLGIALLIVVPGVALVVILGQEVVGAVQHVLGTVRTGGLPALLESLPPGLRGAAEAVARAFPRTEADLQALAGSYTGNAAAAVGGALRTAAHALLQVALMLVALFFLLVDGRRLVDWVAEVSPIGRTRTRELLAEFRNVSEAVLLSSAATAGVQSVVALLGFVMAGVPKPLFFALVTFFVAFIPMIGATSVTLVLAAFMYLNGQPGAALGLGLWGALVVGFSDNVVKPLLMRGRMEVHGAVIFFALLGGLAVFGPPGLAAGPLIVVFFLSVVHMCQRDLAEVDAPAR